MTAEGSAPSTFLDHVLVSQEAKEHADWEFLDSQRQSRDSQTSKYRSSLRDSWGVSREQGRYGYGSYGSHGSYGGGGAAAAGATTTTTTMAMNYPPSARSSSSTLRSTNFTATFPKLP
jgi:hypothetical protein